MMFSKNSLYASRWSGKVWSAVGDSITEVNARTTMHYHDYIKNWIGCSVNNYGISGTGWRTPSGWGGTNAIYNRLNSIASNSDLITVFAGTNDWAEVGVSMTLGALGDTTSSTFYGAVDSTLSNLVSSFPTKTIAVFTPLQRANAWYNLKHTTSPSAWYASATHSVGDLVLPTAANGYAYVCTAAGQTGATEPTWPTTWPGTGQVTDNTVTWQIWGPTTSGASLQDISNAIIAVANKYNVPVLDLYTKGNMNVQNSTFQTNDMPDGLHPNANGHLVLAHKILSFLNSL